MNDLLPPAGTLFTVLALIATNVAGPVIAWRASAAKNSSGIRTDEFSAALEGFDRLVDQLNAQNAALLQRIDIQAEENAALRAEAAEAARRIAELERQIDNLRRSA